MHSTENIELLFRNLGEDWANITPEKLAQRIELLHGIRIEFEEMALPRGYFGACVVVMDNDGFSTGYVLYAKNLPLTQQAHVKTHEIAHLALQHTTISATEEQLQQIQREPSLLFRSNWAIACRASTPAKERTAREVQEDEAELFTRLIYEKRTLMRQSKYLQRGSSLKEMDDALRRMGVA